MRRTEASECVFMAVTARWVIYINFILGWLNKKPQHFFSSPTSSRLYLILIVIELALFIAPEDCCTFCIPSDLSYTLWAGCSIRLAAINLFTAQVCVI